MVPWECVLGGQPCMVHKKDFPFYARYAGSLKRLASMILLLPGRRVLYKTETPASPVLLLDPPIDIQLAMMCGFMEPEILTTRGKGHRGSISNIPAWNLPRTVLSSLESTSASPMNGRVVDTMQWEWYTESGWST